MFTQTWRDHWGLQQDPFACEDADKDPLLAEVDPAAVHCGFDRIYGDPRVPAPGIVFGEKGSGKSGLRRMMLRRLEQHAADGTGGRPFVVEYIDFDPYLEAFRRSTGASRDPDKAAEQVVKRWRVADHLDAVLSLGATRLVDGVLAGGEARATLRGLSRKQRTDLALLTSLYYQSPVGTAREALRRLRGPLGLRSLRPVALKALCMVLTVVGLGLVALPFLGIWELGRRTPWFWAGALVIAGAWGWRAVARFQIVRRAERACAAVRVLPRDATPLADLLQGLRPRERAEFALPAGQDDGNRYELLRRFLGLLTDLGYSGWYVLMDRVDEPSLHSGNDDRMRRFVEKLFDIKLLQYPGLALKLFLPIEMERLHRGASPEEQKRMRLDKSNLIPELKWTGPELYEIATQRIRACRGPAGTGTGAGVNELGELFAEDVPAELLRETLAALATPRYAFGFLSSVVLEYVRDLPGELPPEDPRWRISRSCFDVVRAGWLDRAGLLRRTLN